MDNSVLQLVLQAGLVVKFVLVILLLFSVVSWAIILFKQKYFSKANKESELFLRAYRVNREAKSLYTATKNLALSPIANVFKSVYTDTGERERNEIKRMLRRYETLETVKLEKYLNFLNSNRKIIELEADWRKNMEIIEHKLFELVENFRTNDKRHHL